MPDEPRSEAREPELLDADSLDFGLGVAFGAKGSPRGDGVAAAIAHLTGAAPHVLLRDEQDVPSPVLRLLPPGTAERVGDDDRYQVLGEIARGGLGVVFKGRDRDLGRDVALKVLRPEYARNDAVLARFVEEAQIGGQLQHPGIVPVYSLGLERDGRPYFAMKLVKGRTLAALLAERKSPRDDVRRLVGVFEQVCRTIAYAHSRRVVHRDLKPSNVMVGAFGEVQVVDWGLAKVLGRAAAPERPAAALSRDVSLIATVRSGSDGSASREGSVLGTPGYMSPEQALGQDVDERSDVFALGAILCAILTGDAPILGEERDQVLLAAQGRLDDAHARLAKCGADAELVAIADKCLAPARADRFADAGAVADVVTRHLSGVEARTRKAEIAAANARIRAEDAKATAARERAKSAAEKRAHVRTIVLAAVVLVAVLAGGGAWLHLSAAESQRLVRTAESVSKAMADANARRGAKDFAGAMSAAKKAAALAMTGGADGETSARAAKLLADVEADEAAAAAAAAQSAKDAAFFAKLDDIRGRRADGYDNVATDAEFAAAFRDAGLDVDAEPAETVAARIRGRGAEFAIQVAGALDTWALLRRYRPELKDRDAARPAAVARLADPDPWRDRLRDAIARQSVEDLRDLAAKVDVSAVSAVTVDVLSQVLCMEMHDARAAGDLLRRALLVHPDDFWFNLHMAVALDELGSEELAEAAAFATAAVALRPRAGLAWNRLGWAHQKTHDLEAAQAACRKSIALEPSSAVFLETLAVVHMAAGELDEAEREARKAVELSPSLAHPRHALAEILEVRGGRIAEALDHARKAAELDPRDLQAHAVLAKCLLASGRPDEALREARFAISLDRKSAIAWTTLYFALGATGAPKEERLAAIRNAAELRPDSAEYQCDLGLALLHSGDAAAALKPLETAVRLARPGFRPSALADYGSACVMLGRRDAARRAFEVALQLDRRCSEAFVGIGCVLHLEGRCDRAVAEYRKALDCAKGRREEAVARGNLGLCLSCTGQHAEALVQHLESIRLDCDNAIVRSNLGVTLRLLGRDDEAVAAFREAIRIDRDFAGAHRRLGELLKKKGDTTGAVAALREAVRADPKNAEVRVDLAWMLSYDLYDYAAALSELEEAVRLAPTNAWPRFILGEVRRVAGDDEGAVAALREALDLDPGLAGAHERLVHIAMRLDRDAEALVEARAAVRLEPDKASFRAVLGWVLVSSGSFSEGVSELRAAAEGRDDDDAMEQSFFKDLTGDFLAGCERLQRLESKLPSIVKRAVRPKDASERRDYIALCTVKGEYAAATDLYREAFAADPDFDDRWSTIAALVRQSRWSAAAAAVAASVAPEAGASARADLRRQALAWLREDLPRLCEAARSSDAATAASVRRVLMRPKRRLLLAPVRDPPELSKLPSDERVAWTAFWTDLDAALAVLTGKK